MITGAIIAILSMLLGSLIGYIVSLQHIKSIKNYKTTLTHTHKELELMQTISQLERKILEYKNTDKDETTKVINDAYRDPKTKLLTYKKITVKEDDL